MNYGFPESQGVALGYRVSPRWGLLVSIFEVNLSKAVPVMHPIETLDIPADPSQEIVIKSDHLMDLMVRLFKKKGMYEAEARIGAARLLEADLRGIHSHGSRSIWRYLDE